jgi:hypothetical protein
MALTEEEKKEYLINYQPIKQLSLISELILFFTSGLIGAFILTELNNLGYTNVDLDKTQKILFFLILALLIVILVKYIFEKGRQK